MTDILRDVSQRRAEQKTNWEVFPYSDESVINLRFIRTELGLPVVNKMFRRSDYRTCAAFEAAVENAVTKGNEAGFNVYQCVNPINNDCQAKAAKDDDIFCIANLFIDIDRAGDSKLPATNEEVKSAENYASTLVSYLTGIGWPEPTIVMSGNGYHVYYGLDEDALEHSSANRVLRRTVLKCLADKFDTPSNKIDRCVHNASRVTKFIGTVARKGKDSKERPYRLVRLVSKPRIYFFVTNAMMRDLVSKLQSKPCGGEGLTKFQQIASSLSAIPETPRQIARLQDMLNHIDAHCDRSVWLGVVWGILSTGWPCAEAIAESWSKTAPDKFDQDDFDTLVSSYNATHSDGYSVGTVLHYARLGGWNG